jgi:hypothetical protein
MRTVALIELGIGWLLFAWFGVCAMAGWVVDEEYGWVNYDRFVTSDLHRERWLACR